MQPLVAALGTAASLRILPQHHFFSNADSVEAFRSLFNILRLLFGTAIHLKMRSRTCSHVLLLTYAFRNTRGHINAACGRHPQRCETSCIPHAYITPFPPPPADHSSVYPALAHPLLLSLSLSYWNQSGCCPPLSSNACVTPGPSKECPLPRDLKSEKLAQICTTCHGVWCHTTVFMVKLPLPHVCSCVFNMHMCARTHARTHTFTVE